MKSAAVTRSATSERDEALKVIKKCDAHFRNMQKEWYEFAVYLEEIFENKWYEQAGLADNFKEFFEDRFPGLSYKSGMKFIAIRKHMGKQIDKRRDIDPNYELPAYESCYTIITAEKYIPAPELTKLQKLVLDSKEDRISFHKLRARIQELKPVKAIVKKLTGADEKEKIRKAAEEAAKKTETLDLSRAEEGFDYTKMVQALNCLLREIPLFEEELAARRRKPTENSGVIKIHDLLEKVTSFTKRNPL